MKTKVVETDIFWDSDWDEYNIGDKGKHTAPEFNVWKDIKNDIRITLINSQIRGKMTELENAVITYFNCINDFKSKVETIERDAAIRGISPGISGLFFTDFDRDNFIESSLSNYSPRWIESKKDFFIAYIDKLILTGKPYVQESERNFYVLKEKLNEAYTTLEKTIIDIVNKYEFGEEKI